MKLQGYTVNDTTSEALKAVLLLQNECGFPAMVSGDGVGVMRYESSGKARGVEGGVRIEERWLEGGGLGRFGGGMEGEG